MIRSRALLLILFTLLCLPAIASSQAACSTTGNGTALEKAAAGLSAGQWCEMSPSQPGQPRGAFGTDEYCVDPGNYTSQYANGAEWDELNRQVHFIGQTHGSGSCAYIGKHSVYTDATNAWTEGPWMNGIQKGPCSAGQGCDNHAYDNTAVDRKTGDVYYDHYFSNTVRRVRAGVWSSLTPAIPASGTNCCRVVRWFPAGTLSKSGSLVVVDADWGVWKAIPGSGNTMTTDGTTPGWTRLADTSVNETALVNLTGLSATAVTGVYCGAPGKRALIFGSGSTVYKLDEAGAFTTMASAPVSLGINTSSLACDPVSGHVLVMVNGQTTMRQLNTEGTGTWSTVSTTVPSLIHAQLGAGDGLVNAGITTYGVVMYTKYTGTATRTLLYRHTASPTTLLDFISRCGGNGVLRCFGFDGAGDIPDSTGPGAGLNRNWGKDYGVMVAGATATPTIDTVRFASGAGSMKMTVPVGGGTASGGSWFAHFGPNKTGQITTGERIFVQFRFWWEGLLTYANFPNGAGAKVLDISLGDTASCNPSAPDSTNCPTTCPAQGFEFVIQDNGLLGIPSAYANCNGTAAFAMLSTATVPASANVNPQNMITACTSGNPTATCRPFVTGEWMTMKVMLEVGGWNAWANPVKVWLGRQGQPLDLIIDCSNAQSIKCTRTFPQASTGWFFVNSNPATYKMGKLYLHPYISNLTAATGTGSANYDELIISYQDIPDPGAPSGGGTPTPPSAPTGFTIGMAALILAVVAGARRRAKP